MIACNISQSGTSTVGTNDHGSCCIASEPGAVWNNCSGEPSAEVTPSVLIGAELARNDNRREALSPQQGGCHGGSDDDQGTYGGCRFRRRACGNRGSP